MCCESNVYWDYGGIYGLRFVAVTLGEKGAMGNQILEIHIYKYLLCTAKLLRIIFEPIRPTNPQEKSVLFFKRPAPVTPLILQILRGPLIAYHQ